MKKSAVLIIIAIIISIACKTQQKGVQKGNVLSQKERMNNSELLVDAVKDKNIGNFEDAIIKLNKIINIDNKNHTAHYQLALIRQLLQKPADAIFSAQEAVKLDPKNQWYKVTLAELYDDTKKSDLALKIWEQLAKDYPDNLDYFYNVVISNIYLGKWKEAIDGYNKIEKITGVNETLAFAKQRIWLMMKNFEKAADEMKQLIAVSPREGRYRVLLGDMYLKNNMLNKAKIQYDSAIIIEPEISSVYLSLADYYRKNNDTENSKKSLKTAFSKSGVDLDSKIGILMSYYDLSEKYDTLKTDAFELLDILVKAHPEEPKSWSMYADFLMRDKRYSEAEVAYINVIKFDKSKYIVWEQLLMIFSIQQKFDSLISYSSQAIELFPSQPYLFYAKGIALYAKADYEQAANTFEMGKSLILEPNEMLRDMMQYLGEIYFKQKKYDRSDAAFDRVLRLDPKNIHTLNNYSYYLALRGEQLDKAEIMAKKLIDLSPNSSLYYDTYAWVLFKKGSFSEAKINIEKAIELNSNVSAEILEHYGDILWKTGDKTKAVDYWNKSSIKSSASEILKKKIENKNYFE